MKKTVSLVLLLSLVFGFMLVFSFSNTFATASAQDFGDETISSSAEAMCVMEKESGRIFCGKDIDKKLPMASTTKIITAIMVIEKAKDLDQNFVITKDVEKVGGSSIYLREGETLSLRELLYGLMLQSGNDSAVALAQFVFGSVENFCTATNELCARLGAVNTHVVNPHGLHDDNHYTTASDLAKITCYALKNETFKEIVSTKRKTIRQELEKDPRYLKNKNKLLFNYEFATGVKTGYTKKAGRCLVSSAEKNGMEVVAVVLNCQPMFEECEKLLNFALNNYKIYEIIPSYSHVGTLNVLNGREDSVNIVSKKGFTFPLSEMEYAELKVEYNFPDSISAPISKDQIVGEINVSLENQLLFSENIVTIKESQSVLLKDIFNKVVEKFYN